MIVQPQRASYGRFLPALAAWMILTAAAIACISPAFAQSVDEKSPADQREAVADSMTDWGSALQREAMRFAAARASYKEAQGLLAAGARERAFEPLDRATILDPNFPPPHLTEARLHLREGSPLALLELISGLKALVNGYRNQSRLAANILLWANLVLAAALIWVVFILSFRYLPFSHHQLRSRLEPGGHAEGRGWLVWLIALAPFALGLGIIPLLCLALIPVWLYGGRRERVLLGLLVGWFAVQGVASGPFSTLLVGIQPGTRSTLSFRAANENPTPALRAEIREAVKARPQDADLHFALGLARARAGHFKSSTRSFMEATRLRSDDARATTNLANNHYFIGDYDRAAAGYQRAAALDSTLATTHYNLAQAYIKKLFFREGGAAMLRASQHGFEIENHDHGMPPGAVYYLPAPTARYWEMAWQDQSELQWYDLLVPYRRWLGVPPDHIGWWLLATLVLLIALQRLLPRDRLVFECANCGVLACPTCSGEHDGSVLCHGCFGTAERAKSDLVLSTLLRNRRRATEISFLMKVRNMNAWAFGAGELYNGLRKRGVLFSLILAGLAVGIWRPASPLANPWRMISTETFTPVRIACAVGVVLLFIFARYGRSAWRTRQFHLHPASIVRLADLIDGRGERKLKA